MKFVLDTDVVRSGLQSAAGASRLLLCGIAEGAFLPLVSVAMALEYEDVLMRPESMKATGMTKDDVSDFLDDFLSCAELVLIKSAVRPIIQDPSDEIFVETLLNGGGDAIVTFNQRDYLFADPRLASAQKTPIPVILPGEALRRLAWRPSVTTPFAFPRR